MRITETRRYLPPVPARRFHLDLDEAEFKLLLDAMGKQLSSAEAWAVYNTMHLAAQE